MRIPDAKVEISQPTIRIAAPHSWNEKRHFSITGSNVKHRIPVPENPTGGIRSLDFEEQQPDCDNVPAKVEPRVRNSTPPADNRDETETEVDEDDFIDCPERSVGLTRF